MDAEVEKLPENAENLQIKVKAPKEWNDLPLEMKKEVVKCVDFKSSLRLRLTARLERALVDSRKFDFSIIELRTTWFGSGSLVMWTGKKNGELIFRYKKDDRVRHLAPLIAHILKIGNIGELRIFTSGSYFEMEEVLKKTDSIRVKKLLTDESLPFYSTVLLLSKCPDILDSVHIWNGFLIEDLECKVSDLAKISNTKFLDYRYMKSLLNSTSFSEIVTAFANRQNTVGTTVMLQIAPGQTILNFPPIPRTIENGNRISTCDPSIEILFEVFDVYVGMQDVKMHFVPAEPKINNSDI